MKVRYDPGNGDAPIVYEVPDNATDDEIKSLGYNAYSSQRAMANPKINVSVPFTPKEEGISPSHKSVFNDGMELVGDITNAGLRGLGYGMDLADRYLQKPIQKGLYESVKNKDVTKFPSAAYNQIGKPTDGVPTTKQLIEDTGLSRLVPDHSLSEILPVKKGGDFDISTRGALGFIGDTLEDPTTYIPYGKLIKASGKGASIAAKAANVPLKKIGLSIPEKLSASSIIAKTANTLSGVPEKDLETYILRNQEVKEQMAKHGKNFTNAADEYRLALQQKVQAKKFQLNSQIEDALEYFSSPPISGHNVNPTTLKMVETNKVKNALLKSKESLNSILDDRSRAEIDDILKKIERMEASQVHSTAPGTITVKEMHQLKQKLQKLAEPSYIVNGQIYATNDGLSRAAKSAAYQAKAQFDDAMLDVINKNQQKLMRPVTQATKDALEKEIAVAAGVLSANKNHYVLHSIDDAINRKLFMVGQKPNQLFLTGAGYAPQQEKQLKHLGTILNEDIVDPLKTMSSANTMSNLTFMPIDPNGKSATRVLVSAGGLSTVGGMVAGPTGQKVGALIGASATSPQIQRSVIDIGMAAKKLGEKSFKIPGLPEQSYLKTATRARKSADENARPTPIHVISGLSRNPMTKSKADVLQKALDRGEQSYNATYYLMYTTDEDFRRAITEINQ